MQRITCLVLTGLFCVTAGVVGAAHTRAQLLLSAAAAKPGDTITAAIQLKMEAGWHTYWRNAGDSGDATKIKWTLPDGIVAGEIQWPPPEKLTVAGLNTYIYHDEVLLLVPLQVADSFPRSGIEIKAEVSWLECKEVCLPGDAEVSARLEVGGETIPSMEAALIETWRKKLPPGGTTLDAVARWIAAASGDLRRLQLEWSLEGSPAGADFFPYVSDEYEVGGATGGLRITGGKVRLEKEVRKLSGDWPDRITGLLVSLDQGGRAMSAWEVDLPVQTGGAPGGSLLLMLGLAFLGGLILNVMPCVLPVIALKVLGFVNQAKETPRRVRQLGLIYGAGVLVSFVVLAGMAVAVQQAGGLAGWSTAFQNPQFRVLITILMTLVALNLFGVFEITLGGGAMGAAGALAGKGGGAGAFFNGVLATILATPCTAPFLGVAVGFAFTQPPLVVLLIFFCVGLGLTFPFVLLCWQPLWLKLLPKPGQWMERFKVAMGFPMLGTAVWLFWVTATRMGKTGVLWFGLFLVALALAAWIWGEFVQRGSRRKTLAVVICLGVLGAAYGVILEGILQWRAPASRPSDSIAWQPWSAQAVQQAREQGHPVLVDFTADTCLNCKVNLITSIDIPSVRAKLREIGAVTLIADFTDNDPAIAQELRKHGRGAVPLVLVYSANLEAAPQILPAALTPGIVLDALEKAAGDRPDQSQGAKSPR